MLVLTHDWPHWVRPGEQDATQRAAWQSWPAPHEIPQAPQFFGSLSVLAQVPSTQRLSGAAHWQTPDWQLSRPLQVRSHMPQLLRSFERSTQAPLQLVRVPQVAAHFPALHTWPLPHVSPHPPQLLGSLLVVTQVAPHWVWPVPQVVPLVSG